MQESSLVVEESLVDELEYQFNQKKKGLLKLLGRLKNRPASRSKDGQSRKTSPLPSNGSLSVPTSTNITHQQQQPHSHIGITIADELACLFSALPDPDLSDIYLTMNGRK
jgi:hypothetical protein